MISFKYGIGDCVVIGDLGTPYGRDTSNEIGVIIDRYITGPSNRRGPNIWYEIFVCGNILPYLEKNLKNFNYQ